MSFIHSTLLCICIYVYIYMCIYIYMYIYICIYADTNLQIHLTPLSPLISICSQCQCLCFCFANKFIYTIFLDSTYVLIYHVCFSLFDFLHSMTISRSICVSANGTISFLCHSNIPLYIRTTKLMLLL